MHKKNINTTPQKISIIIPFYQKKKGILTKSITSALNQKYFSNIEIIVIDDGSPIQAENECNHFSKEQQKKIKIIKQRNQGPAAARNKGLNSVSKDTIYIAYLDSDDEWTQDHLKNAVTALEQGYDFYFSDFYQMGQSISAFDRAKRVDVKNHPYLENSTYLHQFTGNMLHQIIFGNIIGTSTVVYRYAKNPTLRFREDLIKAGEDYLFWMEFTQKDCKIAFSELKECRYGKGINIYSGTQWGTSDALELLYYETKFRKTILRNFNLDDPAKKRLQQKIKSIRIQYLELYLHLLIHKSKKNKNTILKYLKLDPFFLLYLPINITKLIYLKTKKKI